METYPVCLFVSLFVCVVCSFYVEVVSIRLLSEYNVGISVVSRVVL